MSLFRKMDPKADLGTPTSLKSSVQRGIRTKLLEQFADTLGANDGALLEQIWPKKESVTIVKFKCVKMLTDGSMSNC
jgi:PUA domain protein